jgi:hypothetical protein
MNRFLKHWRHTGRGAAFHAHVISYADDFVSLSRGDAARRRSFPARPPRDSRCVALQISAEPPRTDHAHAKIRNQIDRRLMVGPDITASSLLTGA